MTKKEFIRDYLHFTRRERRAIIVLIIIVIALFISPHFFPSKVPPPISLNDDTGWAVPAKKTTYRKPYKTTYPKFYTKERIKYVYYNRPYDKNYTEKDSTHHYFTITPYRKADKKISIIDINEGDTSAFIALPGIGGKLATRIITFREKLGGFYSINQIGELYGLPDSIFQKIKPYLSLTNPTNRKININTATKEELKSHPYIRWQIANVIVAYREQHGKFNEPEDLEKIPLITKEVFEKLRHYIIL